MWAKKQKQGESSPALPYWSNLRVGPSRAEPSAGCCFGVLFTHERSFSPSGRSGRGLHTGGVFKCARVCKGVYWGSTCYVLKEQLCTLGAKTLTVGHVFTGTSSPTSYCRHQKVDSFPKTARAEVFSFLLHNVNLQSVRLRFLFTCEMLVFEIENAACHVTEEPQSGSRCSGFTADQPGKTYFNQVSIWGKGKNLSF